MGNGNNGYTDGIPPVAGANKGGDGGTDKTKPKRYFYFVGKERYETEKASLTAGEILALVPGVEPGDKLSLEGQGDEPDRLLQDDEIVALEKDRGPLRFTIVPRATFGADDARRRS